MTDRRWVKRGFGHSSRSINRCVKRLFAYPESSILQGSGNATIMKGFLLPLAGVALLLHAQTADGRNAVIAATLYNVNMHARDDCSKGQQRCVRQVSGTHHAVEQAGQVMDIPAQDHGRDVQLKPAFHALKASDISPLVSNFDTAAWLNTNAIPKSASPDVVGAFRFVCNISHHNYDDPIVYPGQPGNAHRHGFFGNTKTNAFSTYETLRKSGDGTCHGGPLNRSAYWRPDLLNGAGMSVIEDHIIVYYKRRPATDPACAIGGAACVGIPPGLRTIFGSNYSTGDEKSPHVTFRCNGPSGDDKKYATLGPAASNCAPGNKILAVVHTPRCWDGVNLDSPDHQSHLAHQGRDDGRTGRYYCPKTHPYIIPEVTLTFTWAVLPGDDPTTWIFSSDIMAGKPAGSTFHADYMEAWDPPTRLAWEGACLDKLLNCADGTMGNGRKLKRPPGFTFEQRPHRVLVPRLTD